MHKQVAYMLLAQVICNHAHYCPWEQRRLTLFFDKLHLNAIHCGVTVSCKVTFAVQTHFKLTFKHQQSWSFVESSLIIIPQKPNEIITYFHLMCLDK